MTMVGMRLEIDARAGERAQRPENANLGHSPVYFRHIVERIKGPASRFGSAPGNPRATLERSGQAPAELVELPPDLAPMPPWLASAPPLLPTGACGSLRPSGSVPDQRASERTLPVKGRSQSAGRV